MATSWKDQINRHTVALPSGITKAMNGRIPAHLLTDVHDGTGKRIGRLNHQAARSFKAMVHQAFDDGVPAAEITATDTYRTIESQQRLWDTRYDHTDHGNGGRTCGGEHRYLKDGEATAACPGASRHGDAGAIDKGNGPRWHAWLEQHAGSYGWEWELASEKWHLHYWPGDDIPQAVLDFEAGHDHEEPDLDETQDARLQRIERMLEDNRWNFAGIKAIADKVEALDDIDDEVIAGVLAGLKPEDVANAITKAGIKEAVLDALREGTG